jgi:hypothetical protein
MGLPVCGAGGDRVRTARRRGRVRSRAGHLRGRPAQAGKVTPEHPTAARTADPDEAAPPERGTSCRNEP